MKKNQIKLNLMNSSMIMLIAAFVLSFNFNVNAQNSATNAPVFSKFVYEGKDQVYIDNPLEANEF